MPDMNICGLYVIIPVFNRKEYTRSCLLSLKRQTVVGFNIIVVNDGSTDGTPEMIKSEFPEIVILNGDGNLWWAEATNVGVKYALGKGAKYIMTLNDDTIASEDFIEKMLCWAEKEPNALLGSLALDVKTNKPVYGGEIINWKTGKSEFLLDNREDLQWNGLNRVSHYPGRGLLIPAEVFTTIGFYDSVNFPQTVADDDFTHRAARAGYSIYCNYDARLYTYPEESGNSRYRKNKNLKNYYRHLFSIKGGGNLKFFTIYAIKNCPKKYLILFLTTGLLRRMLGYLIEWSAEMFIPSKKLDTKVN